MPVRSPAPSPAEVQRADDAAALVRVQFQAMQRAQAQLCATLAVVDNEGLAWAHGFGRVSSWLKELSHVSDYQATALLRRAAAFHPRQDGSNVIPALAPLTAEAAAAGELSDAHIDTIIDLLGQIPAEHHDTAEPHLLDMARNGDAAQVRAAGQRILAHVSPDGPKPDDREPPEPQRSCWLRKKQRGGWKLEADVDDVAGEFMNATLDALSQPRTGDDGPDLRDITRRKGDALVDVFDMAMNSPELPTQAGERVHLTVTIPEAVLKTAMGQACLNLTQQISAWEARVWACDCTLIPATLGAKGEVLDLGRAKRLITPGQRRALYLRDRGCAFPSCNRPPRNCQGHHVVAWDHGGPTDLGNLVLLCAHHHRVLHRTGWDVRIAPDGLPEFLPPHWADRQRKPRRNNLHPPIAL